MYPFQQYYGLSLVWIYVSSIFVFLFGIWQISFIAKKLSIQQSKAISLYFWHTILCIIHYQWILIVNNDVIGTYINSLDLSFNWAGQDQYFANIFTLNFYRIFSYYLRFSLFTTFLSINIIGSNAILFIEYFYKKLSNNFPRNTKFILGLFIWLPSLHFWTVLGKDTLMIYGILLCTFSMEKINKRYIFLIPSLILISCLRSYISIMVILSILFSISLTSSSIKQSSKLIITSISLFSLFIVFPIFTQFIVGDKFSNLNDVIERISYNVNATSMGTYSISPDLNPFLRIFAYNFRPLFFDVRNTFGLILSFDNLILLIIFIYSILSFLKFKKIKLSIFNQFSIFCASFSLSTSFFLSLSTSNLGMAARHKWMFLPVFFIFLLTFFNQISNKNKSNATKIST